MGRLAALQQPPRSTADTPHSVWDAIAATPPSADDDQRRAFSPPREGLQPCVAPYFADRGVGDMRGPPNSTPKSHPGGGGRPSSHHPTMRYTSDTQNDTHRAIAAATAPHHLRGAIWSGAIWHAPHVATTPRGEIRGFARRQPPPGLEKCPPLVIVSPWRTLGVLK